MIESVENLNAVLEPYTGQTVYNEEDNKVYRWDPIEGWQEQKMDGNLTMSAYDINKQIIAQLPTISEEDLETVKSQIIRKYCDNMKAEYYMLLCRDINYYTVFKIDLKLADETIEDVLIECAQGIGAIKSIALTEDEMALELWMTYRDETYVAYFFPYDTGVIVCG